MVLTIIRYDFDHLRTTPEVCHSLLVFKTNVHLDTQAGLVVRLEIRIWNLEGDV